MPYNFVPKLVRVETQRRQNGWFWRLVDYLGFEIECEGARGKEPTVEKARRAGKAAKADYKRNLQERIDRRKQKLEVMISEDELTRRRRRFNRDVRVRTARSGDKQLHVKELKKLINVERHI